jgi:hypothetical protein
VPFRLSTGGRGWLNPVWVPIPQAVAPKSVRGRFSVASRPLVVDSLVRDGVHRPLRPPPIVEIDLTHRFLPFSPVEAPIGFVRADRFQPSLSPAFEDTFDLDFVVPEQQVMPVSASIKGRGLPSETRV